MSKKKTQQTGIIKPVLYFTPYAWAKIIYLANKGDTEIGAFGFSNRDEPLVVTDVHMVKQRCTSAFVEFDKDSIGERQDKLVDEGFLPVEFGRIWIHTHPGNSPHPSGTDENIFSETFGKCSWSIMAIFCRDGTYYARLQYKQPRSSVEMKVEIDYEAPFAGSNHKAWDTEYATNWSERQMCHIPQGVVDLLPDYYRRCNMIDDDPYPFPTKNHLTNAREEEVRNVNRPFVPLGQWRCQNHQDDQLVRVVDDTKKDKEVVADPEIPIYVEDISEETKDIGEIVVLDDPTSEEFKKTLLSQLNQEEEDRKEQKNVNQSQKQIQSPSRSGEIGFIARSSCNCDRGWRGR